MAETLAEQDALIVPQTTPVRRRIILGGAMIERPDNNPSFRLSVEFWKVATLGLVRSYKGEIYDKMSRALGPNTQVVLIPDYGLKMPRDTLDQVVEEMELSTDRPTDIVAHSYGGIIAPNIAAECSEKVNSIVSLDPPGRARVNVLPWNLPWVAPVLKATNNYHISRGRRGYSENPSLPPMLTISSQESGTIIAKDALLLDWENEMRRVMFGRPGAHGGVSDAIIEGKRVELRESSGDLEHVALAWNDDVIELIQEFQAQASNIGKVSLTNSAEITHA